ncbi:MAG: hypothetical protein ABFC31_04870 [Clostridiaceae bacterium]
MKKQDQNDCAALEQELFCDAVTHYMVNDERVRYWSKFREKRPAARRILTAAACLLAAAVITTFAIPSARAAVEEWFNGWFSTSGYLGEESETRTKEPTVEAITEQLGEQVPVTITSVGSDAFAQSMADEFGLMIDEVAFNGKSIFMTGWFTGQSGKFLLELYTGAYVWNEVGSEIYGSLDFLLPDGSHWYGSLELVMTDEVRAIMKECAPYATRDAEGNPTSNAYADEKWAAYMAENGLRFTLEANPGAVDAKPLTGEVTAKLVMDEMYFDEASEQTVPIFSADLGTVTFDADAYKANLQESAVEQSVALSGTHRVLIQESMTEPGDTESDYSVKQYNQMLDFTGVTLSIDAIAFRADDTVLSVSGVLPESWSLAERDNVGHEELRLLFLLDGEPVETLFSGIGRDSDEDCLTFTRRYESSTIPPSAWAAAKTLTIIPYIASPDKMSAVDDGDASTLREVEMLPGAVITGRSNITQFSDMDTLVLDQMDDCAITLTLDDYR